MENKINTTSRLSQGAQAYQLDEIDNQILELLIENTRMPYTEIAKKLIISAGTVHVRVRKMEEAGIIVGSTLNIDYAKMGFSFTAYIGLYLEKTNMTSHVIEALKKIPYVIVAHLTTGQYNVFCEIKARDTHHAKEIIFMMDDIEGVTRTETMISLEESISDRKRLMHHIFK